MSGKTKMKLNSGVTLIAVERRRQRTEEIFRRAMFDPGRYVKREKAVKPGERPEEAPWEDLITWQWRALGVALDEAEKPEQE